MQTKDVIKIIHEMAETGKPATVSGRAVEGSRMFTFLSGQLAQRPVDYFKEKINSQRVSAQRSSHPITLKIPVVAAAMSFGALSLEAKKAISQGTSLVGTADNTGEGGMYSGERKLAKILITQFSTGRFGVTDDYLKAADAIEIKIGQGAKPGQGGLLPGYKVTEAIAQARTTPDKTIEAGQTLHSPAYHYDIFTQEDLKKKVEWLRKITDNRPIIIKLGAGDIEKDMAYALSAQPDIIAVDGREGGTGAAPRVMLEGTGLPVFPALVRARRFLDKQKSSVKKPELWIGGGINVGEEVAVALALGADAVFLGFPLMMAMGCTYCQKCHLGECKYSISTQIEDAKIKEEKNMKDLNVEEGAKRVANYLTALTEEVKMIAGAVGLDDIYKLNKQHLRAFDPYIAKKAGVKSIWD